MGAQEIAECTAAELHARLRRKTTPAETTASPDLLILDVRSPESFATGAIQGVPLLRHLPASRFHADPAAALAALPSSGQIVVVCNHGNSSKQVAGRLRELGRDALSLHGGMHAWGELVVPRVAARLDEAVIWQFDRVGKGCLSYLIQTPQGIWAIDPGRHLGPYLEAIAAAAVPLRRVLDTHAHADHLSGGRELARQAGVGYWLHPFDALAPFELEPAAFDFEPLWEGQRERLGGLEIRVLHTPGHTLGQVSLLVNGAYLLTGDTIFLRSLGRPDLGGRAEAWSRLLHATLQRLAALPEAITVLPGHYADPGEARAADGVFAASLGELRRANEALAARSEDEFVAYIQRGLREIPAPYRVIKRVNLGLESADAARQDELELGPNLCALAHA